MDKKTIQEQLESKRKKLADPEWGEDGKRRLAKSITKWERKLSDAEKEANKESK
jgi:hypothetical protein